METRNKTWSHILSDVYKSDAALKREGATIEFPSIVNNFIRWELIQRMKEENDLFRTIYKDNVGTGSYYQGLRVHEATEFDIDVELDLYSVVVTHKDAGWVQLKCNPAAKREREQLEKTEFLALMDSKGIFVPDKVVKWFKKVCQQALKNLIESGGAIMKDLKFVDSRKCGPALTISVTTESGKYCDVDLVPVYCHGDDNDKHIYHCVPKKGPKTNLWRITHFSAEKRLLEEPGCAKKVIKLLKLFRDRRGSQWNRMASYYLKSIVMYMISSERRISWRESHIGLLFVDALKNLNDALIRHYIPFYPDAKENLLKRVGAGPVEKMQKDLEMILKEIQERPESLREIFAVRYDEQLGAEKVVTKGRSECKAQEKRVKKVLVNKQTATPKATRRGTASGARKISSAKSRRKSSAPGEIKATKARKTSAACSTASLVEGIRCDAETTRAAAQSKATAPKATIVTSAVSETKKVIRAVPLETAAIETTTTTTIKPKTRTSAARKFKIPDVAATKAIIAKTTTRAPPEEVAAAGATKASSTLKSEKSDVAAAKAILPGAETTMRRRPVSATTTTTASSGRKSVSPVETAASVKTRARKPLSARQIKVPSVDSIKAILAKTTAAKTKTTASSEETAATAKTKTKPASARKNKIPNVATPKATLTTATTTRVPSAETEATATAKTAGPWKSKIYDIATAARTARTTTTALPMETVTGATAIGKTSSTRRNKIPNAAENKVTPKPSTVKTVDPARKATASSASKKR